MSDSPPVNNPTAEARPERRRHRPREDDYYDDEDNNGRGRKRYREMDDRGFGREYRAEPQGPRGERQYRSEIIVRLQAARMRIAIGINASFADLPCLVMRDEINIAHSYSSVCAGGMLVHIMITHPGAGLPRGMLPNPGVMNQGHQSMQF